METPEIDRALEDIETRVERLRALYEQYFMGIEKLEPQIPRKELERRIQVLRKEQIRNTAQRFKFNTVVQRYNTMQQYWMRVVREIENGTFRRDVIRAAQRFGEAEMTTLVGKKRAKQFAALAAAQGGGGRKSHVLDEEMELDAADLIEEDEDVEDEAPTPTRGRMAALPPAPAVQSGAWGAAQGGAAAGSLGARASDSASGLGPHDLPVVTTPPVRPAPAAAAVASAPPPDARAPTPEPSAGGRSAGLRWSSSSDDPSSAVRRAAPEVQRKIAEMTAELHAQGAGPEVPRGFGALDLDFDEGPSPARRGAASSNPVVAPAGVSRPLPVVSPPPARGLSPSTAMRAAAPQARAEPAAGSGFGVLDIPFEEAIPQPSHVEAARPSSPGSGIRVGSGSRPETATPTRSSQPQRASAAGAASSSTSRASVEPRPAAADDLSDQRIRQIYAKYVETKRTTQESTAGVTFDKLAASLRAQATKLRSAHPSKSIDYEVVIKDGKTHLKPVLK
jgi:hypothetical protein